MERLKDEAFSAVADMRRAEKRLSQVMADLQLWQCHVDMGLHRAQPGRRITFQLPGQETPEEAVIKSRSLRARVFQTKCGRLVGFSQVTRLHPPVLQLVTGKTA